MFSKHVLNENYFLRSQSRWTSVWYFSGTEKLRSTKQMPIWLVLEIVESIQFLHQHHQLGLMCFTWLVAQRNIVGEDVNGAKAWSYDHQCKWVQFDGRLHSIVINICQIVWLSVTYKIRQSFLTNWDTLYDLYTIPGQRIRVWVSFSNRKRKIWQGQ